MPRRRRRPRQAYGPDPRLWLYGPTDRAGHALVSSQLSAVSSQPTPPNPEPGTPNPVFTSDFTTAAIFKAQSLPPNTLRVSLPDIDGRVFVCGGQNLAVPGDEVSIENRATGLRTTVVATYPDPADPSAVIADDGFCELYFPNLCDTNQPGSFCAVLETVNLGDPVVALVNDAFGNPVVIEPPPMRDEESGTTVIGAAGGVVTAPPPGPADPPYDPEQYRLIIPEGAFEDITLVTITPAFAEEFPSTDPAKLRFVGGARVDLGGVRALKPIDLVVPALPDAAVTDQYLGVRVFNLRAVDELEPVDLAFLDIANNVVTTEERFADQLTVAAAPERRWLAQVFAPSAALAGDGAEAGLTIPYEGFSDGGLLGVYRAGLCTAHVSAWVRIDDLRAAFIPGHLDLTVPVTKTGIQEFTVPVPCNQPIQLQLTNADGAQVDFLSLNVVPKKNQFVSTGQVLTDDHTPPTADLTQASPPNPTTCATPPCTAVDVGHDAVLSIPFSEAIRTESIAGNVTLCCVLPEVTGGGSAKCHPDEVELRGEWSQSADLKRLYFVADATDALHGLPLAAACRVVVMGGPGGLRDLGDNPLADTVVLTFNTFRPTQVGGLSGIDARSVERLGWFPLGALPSDKRLYLAVGEGEAPAGQPYGGVVIAELSGTAVTPESTYLTDGIDWGLRFADAEPFADAQNHTYQGPYLFTVSGAGVQNASVNRSVMGTFHLLDLSPLPNPPSRIVRRWLNHSTDSAAELVGLDPNEDIQRLHHLRQLDLQIGIPLDVASLGVEAAYIANSPLLGFQAVNVRGFVDLLEPGVPKEGPDGRLIEPQIRGLTTLKNWVIGNSGSKGLVVVMPTLTLETDAVKDVYANVPVSGQWVLGAPDWPIDLDRDGRIDGDETWDMVVAPCVAGGPAICVTGFDAVAGNITLPPSGLGPQPGARLRLPADSAPLGAVLDPVRRLLYVADCTRGLTIVDLQDPRGTLDHDPPAGVDDRVLFSLPLQAGGHHACAQEVAFDINAEGRTIAYVAAGADGLFLVDLGPARMGAKLVGQVPYQGTWQTAEVAEVRYFNEKRPTLYQPEAQLPGRLAEKYGDTLKVTIEAIERTGALVSAPGPNFGPAQLPSVELQRVPQTNRYTMARADDGTFQQVLVVSNLPLEEKDEQGALVGGLKKLMQDNFPNLPYLALYGGIGASVRISAEVGEPLEGKSHTVPIEKVDVIVLGIDGLRQDVLYPPAEDNVQEIGMKNVLAGQSWYRVEPRTLAGLGQVLGGQPVASGGVRGDLDLHHLRLPGVSSIFPSITLASWASIFTGAPPNQTGMLGNEFFVRTADGGRITGLAFQDNDPQITLSEGAWGRGPWETRNLTPPGGLQKYEQPHPPTADQNRTADAGEHHGLLREEVQTIFEQLRTGEDPVFAAMRERYPANSQSCGGQPQDGMAIMTLNHYARGASCWLTMTDAQSLTFLTQGALPFDEIPSSNARDYLHRKLTVGTQRNTQPFPAFFALYLAGLDHEAHGTQSTGGHGAQAELYRGYLTETLEPRVTNVVNELRSLDEFYNKIFLITADHGHSRISDDASETYPCYLELGAGTNWLKDMNEPEVRGLEIEHNNNLHIWELARIIAAGNQIQSIFHPRLLIPENLKGTDPEPDELGEESLTETNVNDATLIPALNGDMAHLYLRPDGANWTAHPTEKELAAVAESSRLFLMNGRQIDLQTGAPSFADTSHAAFGPQPYERLKNALTGPDNDLSPLVGAVDLILVRPNGGEYVVYNGLQPSNDPLQVSIASLPLSVLAGSPHYVQAVKRIEEMNDPRRSGDIVLVMRTRTDDLPTQRFTTGPACRGWHGGLNRADSYVPLILAYPGGNSRLLAELTQRVCRPPIGTGQHDCEQNRVLPELARQVYREEYFE